MNDIILLACPACGAKLEISTSNTTLKCQYCGNEIAFHGEGTSVLLESFACCPKCGRNDRAEKVTAILSSQTHQATAKGHAYEGFGVGDWKQMEVQIQQKQVSVLAQQLSSPPKPVRPPIPLKTVSYFMAGMGTLLAGVGILSVFFLLFGAADWLFSRKLIEQSAEAARVLLLTTIYVLLFSVPIIISGLILHKIATDGARKNKLANEQAKAKATAEFEQKTLAWEQVMDRWNRLYYCNRDDGVFILGEKDFFPIEQIEKCIYAT